MFGENRAPVVTMERLSTLTNSIIDHIVNAAGGHVRKVSKTLSNLGFTVEELIRGFVEMDVNACLTDVDTGEEAVS